MVDSERRMWQWKHCSRLENENFMHSGLIILIRKVFEKNNLSKWGKSEGEREAGLLGHLTDLHRISRSSWVMFKSKTMWSAARRMECFDFWPIGETSSLRHALRMREDNQPVHLVMPKCVGQYSRSGAGGSIREFEVCEYLNEVFVVGFAYICYAKFGCVGQCSGNNVINLSIESLLIAKEKENMPKC